MRLSLLGLIGVLAGCGEPREGERCLFRGGLFTGHYVCAEGFVCNTGRDPKVCERPNAGGPGEPCGADVNCRVELWCPVGATTCGPRLTAGEACPAGVGCEAALVCVKEDGGTRCAAP